MYLYQKTARYFAQTADDLKTIAADELESLGASDIFPAYRGLYFNAPPGILYKINFQSRLINRVLAPIVRFACHTDKVLYKKALEIHWDDFLTPDLTFAVFASVSHSAMTHSRFAALRLKDAVADYFMAEYGRRPSVDTREPDVWLNLHIENNKAVISFDTSGGSLHRRGYRAKSVEAPMAETLAAAIIRLSGWEGDVPLIDPLCGSGTLLCEAWMAATRTPAGILRKHFGFERLPDFDADLWARVRKKALAGRIRVRDGLISGSDISGRAVRTARENCTALGAGGSVRIVQQDVFGIDRIENAVIICNPPYGIRMKQPGGTAGFYKSLGDFLKQRCTGCTAYIYFGDRTQIGELGLKPSWKKPLSNGGLDGRLVKVALY